MEQEERGLKIPSWGTLTFQKQTKQLEPGHVGNGRRECQEVCMSGEGGRQQVPEATERSVAGD